VSAARGVAIISTPNRLLRLLPFQRPWNRFHLREYDARALARVVSAVFPRVELCGITATPAILEIEKRRVKQNPFIAYLKTLAGIMLPPALYDRRVAPRARVNAESSTRAPSFDATKFAVDDFHISANGLRECINLIAMGWRV
jgi:hypothetical protein